MYTSQVDHMTKAPKLSAFVFHYATILGDRWRVAALLFALLVMVPVLVVMSAFLHPEPEVWRHLIDHVLGDLLINTFWLVLGVGSGTLLLGVSLGWLMAIYQFPGYRILSWALLLPMAVPAYVTAFVFIGLLDFTGPVQTGLREAFGTSDWFPRIRSTGGVILVMTLALYPYVYLLAKNAFATQGKRALEAAQVLGHSPTRGFFAVALPMARPWIVGGLMLVLMETLADFGTVSVFNYDTFTTAIYKTWFGMFSLDAASQLASLLVIIIFVLLILEQLSRSRMRFTQAGRHHETGRIQLTGWVAWSASLFAVLILMVAFIIPMLQLLLWAKDVFAVDFDSRYFGFVRNTLLLAAIAALLTVGSAVGLSYAARHHADTFTRACVRVATVGYALPGAVLAVGIFVAFAWLDKTLMGLLKPFMQLEAGMLLQGSVFIMLLAYMVRFMAVGFNPVDSAMHRLPKSLDDVSRTLGVSHFTMLRRVHVPILRGGIIAGLLLVFVDVMKEMPITLMTRPFGWDTLAVRIFEMTSEGEWERAALPAVTLVIAGLIPIILLSRHGNVNEQ
jgi:iron(III) transport system permease protein